MDRLFAFLIILFPFPDGVGHCRLWIVADDRKKMEALAAIDHWLCLGVALTPFLIISFIITAFLLLSNILRSIFLKGKLLSLGTSESSAICGCIGGIYISIPPLSLIICSLL